jgi:hypothetical protein
MYRIDKSNNPIKINTDGKIISIKSGMVHTMILTDTGLYIIGTNVYNQMGYDNGYSELARYCNVYTPIKVNQIQSENIISIKCGHNHSVVCTTNGLFSCGRNNKGQLGYATTGENFFTFTKIDIANILAYDCTGDSTVVWTTNGIKCFGENIL